MKNYSLSQKAFISTLITLLSVITYSTFKELPVDYEGMSFFIGAVGTIYWGRSKTKSDNETKGD